MCTKNEAFEILASVYASCNQISGGKILGACKFIKPPRKKVQSDKLRLHLLFAANIQRQRLIKLIPTYQAARTKTPVR